MRDCCKSFAKDKSREDQREGTLETGIQKIYGVVWRNHANKPDH